MQDISGFGLRVTIRASVTYPQGVSITQFADDADAVDAPSIQIADKAMGLNGDLVTWSTANPLLVTLNVIPGTEDELNLRVLLDANRVARGKRSARDVITMVASYPDGRTVIYRQGKITDGMMASGVASSGRIKTNPFQFAFEDVVRS